MSPATELCWLEANDSYKYALKELWHMLSGFTYSRRRRRRRRKRSSSSVNEDSPFSSLPD
jgi:hypothetical protein